MCSMSSRDDDACARDDSHTVDAYEALGNTGPEMAWAAFTDGFHRAAALPDADPAEDDPQGVPLPVPPTAVMCSR